ncbi:XRE family transcriptional regulator [Nocardia asiatica]|uniref:XRE family transcriptional regulator n=1 Tax=Nocardia asiatica TaxID=209252 RepID=UPI002454E6F4|nr:XRE family transcriptional regulator [Nocardia asiatica]
MSDQLLRRERLTELRKLLGYTQTDLERLSRIPQPDISQIEKGDREFTHAMAYRIATATATPIEYFTHTTPSYDELAINFRRRARVSKKSSHSVLQMFKEIERVANHLSKAQLRLRRTPLPVATKADLTDDDIEQLALDTRRSAGMSDDAPIRHVIRTVERFGIAVAATRTDDTALLDGHCGMSRWATGSPRATVAYIAGESGDRQRFTMAHELAHVVAHSRRSVDLDLREREAHRFAGAFLLPKAVAVKEISESLTLHGYMKLKAGFGISIQAAIARGRNLGLVSQARQRSLMIQISSRGWRTAEPVEVGSEQPSLLWHELTALYGRNPYFAASTELGINPELIKTWIPPRGTQPTTDGQVIDLGRRQRTRQPAPR